MFPPPIFPLVPIFGRRTFRYDVLPGKIWRFEQKQGIGLGLNVAVNVRMTVRVARRASPGRSGQLGGSV